MFRCVTVTVLALTSLVALSIAADADAINFNSESYCGISASKLRKTLGDDDKVILTYRTKTSGLPSFMKSRCEMTFSTGLFNSRKQLRVKFDTVNRYINTPLAKLTFYDYSEPAFGKKIGEVSQAVPVASWNTTVTTKSGYLTIEADRDVGNAKDYYVEMVIEAYASGATTQWSLTLLTMSAALVRVLS